MIPIKKVRRLTSWNICIFSPFPEMRLRDIKIPDVYQMVYISVLTICNPCTSWWRLLHFGADIIFLVCYLFHCKGCFVCWTPIWGWMTVLLCWGLLQPISLRRMLCWSGSHFCDRDTFFWPDTYSNPVRRKFIGLITCSNYIFSLWHLYFCGRFFFHFSP